jgi:hypothetical protein
MKPALVAGFNVSGDGAESGKSPATIGIVRTLSETRACTWLHPGCCDGIFPSAAGLKEAGPPWGRAGFALLGRRCCYEVRRAMKDAPGT